QFAAFVDGPGRFRRDVTGNAARKGKLFEQPFHSLLVLRDVRIDFAVGAFQVRVRHQPGSAVSRAGDIDHVQVLLLDDPVEVDVDEIQSRRRAPVAQQAGLDVLALQGLLQQGIVVKINLADGQVVCGAPVSVDFPEQIRAERFPADWTHTLGSFRWWEVAAGPRSRSAHTVCAMCNSSSVRMTRTVALPPSLVITGAPAWLRAGSSSIPR